MSNTESKPREFVMIQFPRQSHYQAFLKDDKNSEAQLRTIELTPFVKKAVENHAELVAEVKFLHNIIKGGLTPMQNHRIEELLKASE